MKVFAASPSYSRAEQIVQDMVRLFGQFTYSGLNSYKFKTLVDLNQFARELVSRSWKALQSDFLSVFKTKKKTIMSIKELISLYHFPHSRFNKNPRIRRQKFKIVPAPDHLPQDGLLIGYNVYS